MPYAAMQANTMSRSSLGVAAAATTTSYHRTALVITASRQRCDVHCRAQASRRDMLATAASGILFLGSSRQARAEEVVAVDVPSTSAPSLPSGLPARDPQRLEDFDFYFTSPVGYTFVDTQPKAPERGPAPEQSPIRARVDSPDKTAIVSVLVRGAQTVKATFLQVNDISVYGTPEETAKLLLPRGSVLLSVSSESIALPPKETPLGTVERNTTYYRYEFLTSNGLHIFACAAAQRGKVYVCNATASKANWDAHKDEMIPSVLSFRLKPTVLGPK